MIVLATAVAMSAPFATDADLRAQMYTSGLGFVWGSAIGSLVAGTGRSAIAVMEVCPYPGQYR